MGDGKFSIWMNLERQISAQNLFFSLEAASCIYIDDFVLAIKNILDNWQPGIYNISYDFIRNIDAIKSVYLQDFEHTTKLGPTGKPRGSLDSSKLLKNFDFTYNYKDYESTIKTIMENMKIFVRNNDVNKALRILKRENVEEGITKELRERRHFVSSGREKTCC